MIEPCSFYLTDVVESSFNSTDEARPAYVAPWYDLLLREYPIGMSNQH